MLDDVDDDVEDVLDVVEVEELVDEVVLTVVLELVDVDVLLVVDVDDEEYGHDWMQIEYRQGGEIILEDNDVKESYHFIYKRFSPQQSGLPTLIEVIYAIPRFGNYSHFDHVIRIAEDTIVRDEQSGRIIDRMSENIRYFIFLTKEEYQSIIAAPQEKDIQDVTDELINKFIALSDERLAQKNLEDTFSLISGIIWG